MVLESSIASILRTYLGEYVEGLNVENLKLGLSTGKLSLKNLKLKVSALDELQLPIKIVAGYLQNLTCHFSITGLWSKQVEILIDSLYILAAPSSISIESLNDTDLNSDINNSVKRKALLYSDILIKSRLAPQYSEQEEKAKGMLERLFAKVVANLKFTINNIHIRYEDNLSVPSNPFSAGLMVNEINLYAVDKDGKFAFVDENNFRKAIDIQGAAIYWQSNSVLWSSNVNISTTSSNKKQQIPTALELFQTTVMSNDDYIIAPSNIRSLLTINNTTDFSMPRQTFTLTLFSFNINLLDSQFRDIMYLLDNFSKTQLKIRISQAFYAYQHLKPSKFNARSWWIYAFRMIISLKFPNKPLPISLQRISIVSKLRKKYIPLFKRAQTPPWLEPLKPKEQDELVFIEDDLQLDQILIFRSQAVAEIENEIVQFKSKKTSLEKSQGFLSSWFSSSKSVDASSIVLTDDERKEIYEKIDYSKELEQLQPPPSFVQSLFQIELKEMNILLRNKKKSITKLFLDGFCIFQIRPSSWLCRVIVNSMKLIDLSQEHSRFQYLIDQPHQVNNNELFIFELEGNPLNSPADLRIALQIKPLQFIFNTFWIDSIFAFFNLANYNSHVFQQALDWGDKKRAQLITSLAHHSKIAISLIIDHPLFIFPIDASRSDSVIFVASFRKFLINSKWDKSFSGDKIGKLIPQNSDMYDEFQVSFRDLNMSVSPSYKDYINSVTKEVIPNFDITLSIHTCLVHDDYRQNLTKLLVNFELTSLHLNLHFSFYHFLKTFFNQIMSMKTMDTIANDQVSPTTDVTQDNTDTYWLDLLNDPKYSARNNIEISFCINHFGITLIHDYETELPLLKFEAKFLQCMFSQNRFNLYSQISLKDIIIYDLTYPEPESPYTYFLSSKSSFSEEKDFINCVIHKVSNNAPEYTGIGTKIDIVFNNLFLSWNAHSIYRIVDLIYRLNVDLTQSATNDSKHPVIIPSNSSIQKLADTPTKKSIEFQVNAKMKLLSIDLNKEIVGKQLSKINFSNFSLQHTLYKSEGSETNISLKNLNLIDLSKNSSNINLVESGNLDLKECAKIQFFSFPPHEALNLGYDSLLNVNLSSISFVFQMKFVLELVDYFNEGVLSAILQSKYLAEATKRFVESQMSEIYFKMKIEIEDAKVLMYNNLKLRDHLIDARIGHLLLENAPESMNEKRYNKIYLDIQPFCAYSIVPGIVGEKELIKKTSINLKIMLPIEKKQSLSNTEKSAIEIFGFLDEVHVNCNHSQFISILNILDQNILCSTDSGSSNQIQFDDSSKLIYMYDHPELQIPTVIHTSFKCPNFTIHILEKQDEEICSVLLAQFDFSLHKYAKLTKMDLSVNKLALIDVRTSSKGSKFKNILSPLKDLTSYYDILSSQDDVASLNNDKSELLSSVEIIKGDQKNQIEDHIKVDVSLFNPCGFVVPDILLYLASFFDISESSFGKSDDKTSSNNSGTQNSSTSSRTTFHLLMSHSRLIMLENPRMNETKLIGITSPSIDVFYEKANNKVLSKIKVDSLQSVLRDPSNNSRHSILTPCGFMFSIESTMNEIISRSFQVIINPVEVTLSCTDVSTFYSIFKSFISPEPVSSTSEEKKTIQGPSLETSDEFHYESNGLSVIIVNEYELKDRTPLVEAGFRKLVVDGSAAKNSTNIRAKIVLFSNHFCISEWQPFLNPWTFDLFWKDNNAEKNIILNADDNATINLLDKSILSALPTIFKWKKLLSKFSSESAVALRDKIVQQATTLLFQDVKYPKSTNDINLTIQCRFPSFFLFLNQYIEESIVPQFLFTTKEISAEFISYKNDSFLLKCFLYALYVEDLSFDKDSSFRYIITSEYSPPIEFIKLQESINNKIPLISLLLRNEGQKMNCSLNFHNLHVLWNPKSIEFLLVFLASYYSNSPISDTKTITPDIASTTNKYPFIEPEKELMLPPRPKEVVFELSSQMNCFAVTFCNSTDEKTTKLYLLEVDNASAQFNHYQFYDHAQLNIHSVFFRDLNSQNFSDILEKREDNQKDMISFGFHSFDRKHPNYPHFDSLIELQLASIKILYITDTILKLTDYFLNNTYKIFSALKTEATTSSTILYTRMELSLFNPIIVIPKSKTSSEIFEMDLGSLHVSNYPILENGYPVDILNIEFSNMKLSSNAISDIITNKMNLNCKLFYSLDSSYSRNPFLSLEAKMGDIKLFLCKEQYYLLLQTLEQNIMLFESSKTESSEPFSLKVSFEITKFNFVLRNQSRNIGNFIIDSLIYSLNQNTLSTQHNLLISSVELIDEITPNTKFRKILYPFAPKKEISENVSQSDNKGVSFLDLYPPIPYPENNSYALDLSYSVEKFPSESNNLPIQTLTIYFNNPYGIFAPGFVSALLDFISFPETQNKIPDLKVDSKETEKNTSRFIFDLTLIEGRFLTIKNLTQAHSSAFVTNVTTNLQYKKNLDNTNTDTIFLRVANFQAFVCRADLPTRSLSHSFITPCNFIFQQEQNNTILSLHRSVLFDHFEIKASYQDVVLLYGIYKNSLPYFSNSPERVNNNSTSSSIKYLDEVNEIIFRGLSFVIINDCCGRFMPLMSFRSPSAFVVMKTDRDEKIPFEYSIESNLIFESSFYNPIIATWEPVIESFSFLVKGGFGSKIEDITIPFTMKISGSEEKSSLNMNISTDCIQTTVSTLSLWQQEFSSKAVSLYDFSPYYIKNAVGIELKYSTGNIPFKKEVLLSPDKEDILNLTDLDSSSILQDGSKNVLLLHLNIEGFKPLKNIVINKIGCFSHTLWQLISDSPNPIPIIVAVSLRNGSKFLEIRTGIKLFNDLPFPISFGIECKEFTENVSIGPVKPNNSLSIPLNMSSVTRFFVMPNQEDYGWSVSAVSLKQISDTSFIILRCIKKNNAGNPMFIHVEAESSDDSTISLHFKSPLILHNLFPCDISHMFGYSGNENVTLIKSELSSGAETHVSVIDLSLSHTPVFGFQLSGYKWSGWINLRDLKKNMNIKLVYDNGNTLVTKLLTATSISGAIEIWAYSTCWLINYSTLPLEYGIGKSPEKLELLPNSSSTTIDTIFENQRYTMISGWTEPFLLTDSHAWCNENNKPQKRNQVILPTDYHWLDDWHVDFNRDVDKEGWEYAALGAWHPKNESLDSTRRRKWIRTRAPNNNGNYITLLGSILNDKLLLAVKIPGSDWSNPIERNNISDQNMSVTYQRVQGGPKQLYDLSVHCENGVGQFSRTLFIYISPAFVIYNHTDTNLLVKQCQTTQTISIKSHHSNSYFWEDRSKPHLISIAFDGWIWTNDLSISQPDDYSISIYKMGEEIPSIVRVQCKNETGSMCVHISNEDITTPIYRIENTSSKTIYYCQAKSSNQKFISLQPQQKQIFAWTDYHAPKPFKVLIRIGPKDVEVPIDQLGFNLKVASINNPSEEIFITVKYSGPTKVLMIHDNSLLELSEKDDPVFQMEINLSRVGISLVHSRHKEIAYISFDQLYFHYYLTMLIQNFHFYSHEIQIDNTSYNNTIYPAVLIGRSSKNRHFIVSTITLALNTQDLFYIKYFAILLQPIHLQIEEKFISNIIDFASDTYAIDYNNSIELTSYLKEKNVIGPITKSKTEAKLVYFDIAELNQIIVTCSFTGGTPEEKKHKNLTGALTSFLLAISNFQNATLRLKGRKAQQLGIISFDDLFNQLSSDYKSQLLGQFYIIIGASTLTGGIPQFFSYVATGVTDLVKEPAEGFVKGPSEFGLGLIKGGGSLVLNTMAAVGNTVSGLTGSLGQGFATLSADDSYLKRRTKLAQDPSALTSVKQIGSGLFEGVSGVVMSPLKGASEEGVSGFFTGVAKGVVGLVVKPVAGILDSASTITNTIKSAADSDVNRNRKRFPRMLYGNEKAIRPYNDVDSILLEKMNECDHGNDSYFEHFISNNGLILIVTNKGLLLLKIQDSGASSSKKWFARWKIIQTFELSNSQVIIHLNKNPLKGMNKLINSLSSEEAPMKYTVDFTKKDNIDEIIQKLLNYQRLLQ